MFLSVIIPTCHRNDLLVLCLDCLAPGTQIFDSSQYEVIVSDDGSKSTSEELVRASYPWVKWVQGPRKGPASNRNFGAKQAKGEWLVFIDDDCLPDKQILNAYWIAIQLYPHSLLLEGKTVADREQRYPWEESPINMTGGNFWSCNIAFNRDAFLSIQGFDEGFPFAKMEDVEIGYRIRKNGWEWHFVPEAFLVHPWRDRKRNWVNGAVHSMKVLLGKHPELKSEYNTKLFLRMAIKKIVSAANYLFKFKFREFEFEFSEGIKLLVYTFKVL